MKNKDLTPQKSLKFKKKVVQSMFPDYSEKNYKSVLEENLRSTQIFRN